MDRRSFLKNALLSTAVYSAAGLPGLSNVCHGAFAPVMSRLLVNINLAGGPDFRHLVAPAFETAPESVGYGYWSAMSAAHGLAGSSTAWEQRWTNDYRPIGDGSFGMLNSCGWLSRMWESGNVAIVANVLGSGSRDHAHASLVLDHGDRTSTPTDIRRAGWGGRLAHATSSKVVSVTRTPRRFCFGPHPTDSEESTRDVVIAANDVRAMNFYAPTPGTAPVAPQSAMTRGLRHYYEATRGTLNPSSVYARFLGLERQIRELGAPIAERLSDFPVPPDIARLYDGDSPVLASPYFGEQIRNLYDAIALNDIFGMRVASLEYLGFDTHDHQREELETRFNDLFGDDMGLDSLWRNLPDDARANTVFVLAGEFGRQIRANGDAGTDHGEGFYVLLIGEPVRGGVYGDPYPESELSRLDHPSPQIEGRTAIDHVFGRVCDWIQPGAGDVVFPDRAAAPIEPDLDLGPLLG